MIHDTFMAQFTRRHTQPSEGLLVTLNPAIIYDKWEYAQDTSTCQVINKLQKIYNTLVVREAANLHSHIHTHVYICIYLTYKHMHTHIYNYTYANFHI